MLNFIIFTSILIVCYLTFFFKQSNKPPQYTLMDRGHTTILKAIAIIMVVWGHVGAMMGVPNIQFVGGVGVSLFLICSGYGLFSSYKSNVEKYGEFHGLKDYWKKKVIKVVIPYWVVEIFGLSLVGETDVSVVIKDLFFITPATSYGWYMQYLMICYILFWIVMIFKKIIFKNTFYYALVSCFLLWFIVESLLFADPNMPFLRARQMLAFPLGVLLSFYIKSITNFVSDKKHILLLILVSIIGVIVTGISQLDIVKTLPYLISNAVSLFTVLPIAIGIVVITIVVQFAFQNAFLYTIGAYSYEIYLIHAFSLETINKSTTSLLIFIFVTIILVITLARFQKAIDIFSGRKHGRFNSGYPYKK